MIRAHGPALLVGVLVVWGAAALSGCGDAGAPRGSAGAVQCLSVRAPEIALAVDEACTVSSHPLAAERLADLGFTPGACFTTGTSEAEIAGAGGTAVVRITAYSGISSNSLAGPGLASFPLPLVDASGRARLLAPFTAASVITVSRRDGADVIGELATRDTGWVELDGVGTLPRFVTERLVVTGGSGALANTTGEIFATGDEFVGVPATGSLCGPGLADQLLALR